MGIYNLISFLGIFALLGVAWIFSDNKRKMNWHLIVWGIALQMGFALFIFVFPAGAKVFMFINDAVIKALDCASAGTQFVFGRLALPPGAVSGSGEPSLGFILAFQAFPTIIFFSALMSVLYFLNIMPVIIRWFASVFGRTMKISGAEAMVAASNIFVGVESALTVRPHLKEMTHSELCTVLTAGMATVASNVLAIYIFSLRGQFPNIAGHLISASFLSAPAALIMSKIILPERGRPQTLGKDINPHYEKDAGFFDSVINGANAGVKVIVGIAALLIAVLGLVALLDLVLGAAGGRINSIFNLTFDWSLKGILGYIFYPFTLAMGIPLQDAGIVSRIVGERLVVTEVTAYQDLAVILGKGLLTDRSAVITTYALCGFAHIASMAIFVGGVSALVPQRGQAIAKLGFRALFAATLACLLTACVAGVFFTNSSVLFGR